jgi:hypothetical protein
MNTMTKQEQLADFLHRSVALPRAVSPYGPWAGGHAWAYPDGYMATQRPSIETVAHEMLAHSEFRALQLGTWLGTTDGQVLVQAVEMVAPPFYRQDVELLVEALKLAASIQQREGQQAAGMFALGAIGVAVLVGVGIYAARSGESGTAS